MNLNYIKQTKLLLIGLGICLLFSCSKDDAVKPSLEILTGETIDLGDVPAGSAGVGTITVIGEALKFPVYLTVTGDNFALDKDFYPAANIKNSSQVLLVPPIRSALGPVSGMIKVSSSGIEKTIEITANVVAPVPLEVGEEVYYNNMEFGLANNDPISESDFAKTESIYPALSSTYTLSPAGGDPTLIRTDTNAMCENGTVGDCGNAFKIYGDGTAVLIELTGLDKNRSYIVTYWVRPGGSSDRSMDVTVTGDTEPAYEYWGGYADRSFYREVTRTGVADDSGAFSIEFKFSYNSTGRNITVDNLRITAN